MEIAKGKEFKRFNVPFNFSWAYGISIKDLRNDLDKLEKLGATDVDIEAYERYGDAEISIHAYSVRLETEEEFQKRIEDQKKIEEGLKAKELDMYNAIKAKYNL
jgi:hypothetical protein